MLETVSKGKKKITVRPQDLKFAKFYQSILAGNMPDVPTVADIGDEAYAVMDALQSDGIEGAKKAMIALMNRTPRLAAALATLPTANEEEQEQEEEDKDRFIKHDDGKRSLKLWSIDDLYALPDPKYLVSKILSLVGVSLLYGPSNTGKTFAAINMALSIAHGEYWFGRRVEEGSVLYINAEGRHNFKKRLMAWYKEHPTLSPTAKFQSVQWSVDLQLHYQEIIETIKRMPDKPVLIIVDNFSMCADVEQDKQREVSKVLGGMNNLAQTYETHVMIIHHTNKSGDFNGSQAFKNHVDAMIELKKEDPSDKNSAILFCSEKNRDEENFPTIRTELKVIDLFIDPNTLETITSGVIIESEDKTFRQPGLKPVQQDILDILGTEKLGYTEWQNRCVKDLKISTATFGRELPRLESQAKIAKCKVEGIKNALYYQVFSTSESEGDSNE